MEDMPKIILTVSVTMIVLAVGVFAFFVTTSEIGYTKRRQETFSVSDPSVAKTCDLQYYQESIISVEQYNGITWVAVSASDYSVSPEQVIVQPGGMQG